MEKDKTRPQYPRRGWREPGETGDRAVVSRLLSLSSCLRPSSLTLPVSFRLSSFLRSPPLARRARDRCAASGRVRGKWSEESQETG